MNETCFWAAKDLMHLNSSIIMYIKHRILPLEAVIHEEKIKQRNVNVAHINVYEITW